MNEDLRRRSAAEVFDDHLALAGEHRFEEDIERNVAPECIILERRGVFHGRDGARHLAALLAEELPGAPYAYTNRLVQGRFAFLDWTSEAAQSGARASSGTSALRVDSPIRPEMMVWAGIRCPAAEGVR